VSNPSAEAREIYRAQLGTTLIGIKKNRAQRNLSVVEIAAFFVDGHQGDAARVILLFSTI
jgi:hypothetical protein